ncbi:hypothetical protein JCM6882_001185 [Rhodosporidiobolus microsporus]
MACAAPTTTTTTQHWQLEKYSRSRAPFEPSAKRSKLDDGGRGGHGGEGDKEDGVEWDHYTQPQLSLKLQTTFSPSSSSGSSSSSLQHVQSMLLSISFDPLFRDHHRAKQHLTLDLLDLAAFSSPAVQAATPKDQLPLKTVYKDAVLGLRYISLDGEGGRGQFKRLQVKFVSQDERERFLAAVGAFVPSKPAVEAGTTPSKPRSKVSSKTPTPSKKRAPEQQQQAISKAMPRASSSAAQYPHTPNSSTHPQLPSPAVLNSASSTPARRPPSAQPSGYPALPNYPSTTAFAPVPPATAAPPSLLPPRLSTLLPSLSSSSQRPPSPALTASQQLAQLSPADFGTLLQEVLLEDGFEDLVAAVQEVLKG